MKNFNLSNCELTHSEGVFTLKNINTTIGFVRFNEHGEIEYIFVNPIFRKKGLAKKLLKLVREKTGKKIILQPPYKSIRSEFISLNKRF